MRARTHAAKSRSSPVTNQSRRQRHVAICPEVEELRADVPRRSPARAAPPARANTEELKHIFRALYDHALVVDRAQPVLGAILQVSFAVELEVIGHQHFH